MEFFCKELLLVSQSPPEEPWTQPYLTSNGTLGGSSFAVSASSTYDSAHPLWKAFDNASNTMWLGKRSEMPIYIILYNPDALKISNINFTNRSDAEGGFTSGSVEGSNTNGNWTSIKNWSNSVTSKNSNWNVAINSTSFYKYYKIIFSTFSGGTSSTSPGLLNVTITATKLV